MEDHSLVAEEKLRLLREKEKKMEDLKKEKEVGEMLSAKVKVKAGAAYVSGCRDPPGVSMSRKYLAEHNIVTSSKYCL